MTRQFFPGAVLCGAVAANAFAFPGPAPSETFRPHIPWNAMNPAPTRPPVPHEFIRRRVGDHQGLERRQDAEIPAFVAPDNTCGYVDGSSGAPYACANSATCAIVNSIGNIDGWLGCCDSVECSIVTTCMEAAEFSASCDGDCMDDSSILKCLQSTRPNCLTATFSGGAVDYFCDSLTNNGPVDIQTTFDGQTGVTWSSFNLADVSGTGTDSPSSVVPIPPPATTVIVTPSPVPDNGSNTGAIVGGVVGGIAAVGIAAFLAWFFCVRKKKGGQASAAGTAAAVAASNAAAGSLPGQPGQPAMYEPVQQPPGGYNPQQPYDQYNPANQPNQAPYDQQQQQQFQSPHTSYQVNSPGIPPYSHTPPPPQGTNYYGVPGKGNLSPDPNRADTTSPVSDYNRQSAQQPMLVNNAAPGGGYADMQQPRGGVGGQAPIEAGGVEIGREGRDSHHKGQLHEIG